MVAEPGEIPVTATDAVPDATVDTGPVLLHVPPPTRSFNTILDPGHTEVAPIIPDGVVTTVTTRLALQPDAAVV